MKKLLIMTSVLASLSMPVLAQEAPALDADDDGVVSLEEFTEAYPDLQDVEDVFHAIDSDEDGVLTEDEIAAAL